MPDRDYAFDVFLSHSSKDKPLVRPIAKLLKDSGLRIWFDEWQIQPGDNIPAKIEEGLQGSRILVLCISANSLGSDWATLESQTFRFTDTLNRKRRFVPLRLDETEPYGSLLQFAYVDWRDGGSDQACGNLLAACKPGRIRPDFPRVRLQSSPQPKWNPGEPVLLEGHSDWVSAMALSADGRRVIIGSLAGVQVWNLDAESTRHQPRELKEHDVLINDLALNSDGQRAVCASGRTLRVWNLCGNDPPWVFEGSSSVEVTALSADGRRVISGWSDGTVRTWDLSRSNPVRGARARVFEGHVSPVCALSISADGRRAISGSRDKTLRVWDLVGNSPPRVFEKYSGDRKELALSSDGRRTVFSSDLETVQVWDLDENTSPRILRGYRGWVGQVTLNADGRRVVVASMEPGICGPDIDDDEVRDDYFVQVLDLVGAVSLRVVHLNGTRHDAELRGVTISSDGRRVVYGEADRVWIWDL
jgi:hypothetical protein